MSSEKAWISRSMMCFVVSAFFSSGRCALTPRLVTNLCLTNWLRASDLLGRWVIQEISKEVEASRDNSRAAAWVLSVGKEDDSFVLQKSVRRRWDCRSGLSRDTTATTGWLGERTLLGATAGWQVFWLLDSFKEIWGKTRWKNKSGRRLLGVLHQYVSDVDWEVGLVRNRWGCQQC